jgi:nucleotide-binding universal stress UspA family protein
MARNGPIVVGVDGSVDARRALDWAVAEARVRCCAVCAVHAWTVGAIADFTWRPRDALRRESMALLRTATRNAVRVGGPVELSWSSVEGEAAQVLLELSAGSQLLVLAAHRGLAPPDRPLGSVTETCLREATVPVAVIPEHHDGKRMWTRSSFHSALRTVGATPGPTPPGIARATGTQR